MHSRTSMRHLGLGALTLALAAASVNATVLGTSSFTGTHGGDTGDAGNSTGSFAYTGTGTVRSIAVTGSLTAIIPGTYASEAASIYSGATGGLRNNGAGILLVPGVQTFTTPQTINQRLYIPGGAVGPFSSAIENIETYDDDEAGGADSSSAVTYSFDDAYGPGNAFVTSGQLTSSSPTFNRNGTTGTTGDIAVGVGARYSTFTFTVSTTGSYVIVGAADFDSYYNLYSNSFNPLTPTVNAAGVADEAGAVLLSTAFDAPVAGEGSGNTVGLGATLTAGTTYTLVTTTYGGTTSATPTTLQGGDFTNVILGPGVVSVVPEPTSLGLLGLGAVALLRRRR